MGLFRIWRLSCLMGKRGVCVGGRGYERTGFVEERFGWVV